MRGRMFAVFAVAVAAGLSSAFARGPSSGTPLERARDRAQAGSYESALQVLDSLLAQRPGDLDARVLKARVLSWQGDFPAADAALDSVLRAHPGHAEARIVRANLLYYRGDLPRAQAAYEAVVADHPGDVEAREGLARVLRARASAPRRERPWRADVGGEYSVFTRRTQADWKQGFAQLSRTLPGSRYSVYGRMDGYAQFGNTDVSLEAGAFGRLREGLHAAVLAGYTPAADFKPDLRAAGDLRARLYAHPSNAEAWLLLAGWYDVYDPLEVWRAASGLRLQWRADWVLAGRGTFVRAEGDRALYGWDARAEAPVLPGRLRAHLGLADAPETVAGVTVATFSVFGGLAYLLDPDRTLHLGYARDDRENAYIRHAFNASLAQRF